MPVFSKSAVNRAGFSLRDKDFTKYSEDHAIEILNYWRGLHIEPLQRSIEIIDNVLDIKNSFSIAGRIKKFDTIVNKLHRVSGLKLATMYDIAGCRIVVDDLEEQLQVCDLFQQSTHFDSSKSKDYIKNEHPSGSGYRARHLVFKFDDLDCGHTLFSELQIRTKLQHAWATSDELFDRAYKGKVKFGITDTKEKQFFRRASELIKQVELDNDIDEKSIREKFPIENGLKTAINVTKVLKEASSATTVLTQNNIDEFEYCLVDLYYAEQSLFLTPTSGTNAIENYYHHEKYGFSDSDDDALHDTVLVRANSLDAIKTLYPNYLGDISEFTNLIDKHFDVFA